MKNYLKVKDVAEQLHVSPSAVRLYTNTGALKCERTHSGQRYFTQSQVNEFLGVRKDVVVFYVRSSSGDESAMESQVSHLTEVYGHPTKVYRDKGSGLNENRRGLASMMRDAKAGRFDVVCISNEDRLSRFGFSYIEDHLNTLGVSVKVMNENTEKTPYDELMSDFMSLLASFSGKFYRLRGYEQQRHLLKKAEERIDEKETH